MIEPTKHEQLKQNILVIGSEIIRFIRNSPANLEEVYQLFKKDYNESQIDKFYDAITFLWLLNFIHIEDGLISLTRPYDVSEKTLF
jgi:uncharacterized membrane protein